MLRAVQVEFTVCIAVEMSRMFFTTVSITNFGGAEVNKIVSILSGFLLL